jgi:hypothetical protein
VCCFRHSGTSCNCGAPWLANEKLQCSDCFNPGRWLLRYGLEGAAQRLRSLKLLWVSHMHADHHGGLYPLLQQRQRLLGPGAPPLLIVGPFPLWRVLQGYQQVGAVGRVLPALEGCAVLKQCCALVALRYLSCMAMKALDLADLIDSKPFPFMAPSVR